jgi:aspartokinase
VVLAGTLGAIAWEILTDVNGVFTADPRIVEDARLLADVEYGQMLALAQAGAGVLMPQAVEFARERSVPVHVRSSFTDDEGTWVRPDVATRTFVGIAHRIDPDQGVVTVVGSRAHQAAAEEMVAMHDAGMVTALVGSNEQSVSVSIAPEQIEDVVRFLHIRLFQMEATT